MTKEGLSPRQSQIVEEAAKGLSNADIAATFNLSVKTIETHKSSIQRFLGTNAAQAWALGIMSIIDTKTNQPNNTESVDYDTALLHSAFANLFSTSKPTINRVEVEEILGCGNSKARRMLAKMVNEGHATPTSRNRTGAIEYSITQEGLERVEKYFESELEKSRQNPAELSQASSIPTQLT